MSEPGRPVSLLIGALGGEGGGVLTNWVTAAARASDLAVQSTSVPGVAQRTGATTYYVEVYRHRPGDSDHSAPVLALFPNPGMVDVMVASELAEAGRAMERGFVTPDRTILIASTHRIFSIGEKSSPADGRFAGDRVIRAAQELAKSTVMFDMQAAAQDNVTTLNAVLLGCIAGTGRLPIERDAFEAAIRASGKAVERNLRGFRCGVAAIAEATSPVSAAQPAKRWTPAPPAAESPLARVRSSYPATLHDVVEEAVARLTDYQGRTYAIRYLHRLDGIYDKEQAHEGGAFGFRLTREVARHLAVWMSYEDVVRVADLKTRAQRLQRLRREVGADADQPIRVTEFLKPGLEEWCGMLPPFIGGPVMRWATRRGWQDRFKIGLRLRTTTVLGFLRLYALGRLHWWRPATLRFKEEQAAIDQWLDLLAHAMARDYRLAVEVAALPRLHRGYGETRRGGVRKYNRILADILQPFLTRGGDAAAVAAALSTAAAKATEEVDDGSFDTLLTRLVARISPAPPRAAAAE